MTDLEACLVRELLDTHEAMLGWKQRCVMAEDAVDKYTEEIKALKADKPQPLSYWNPGAKKDVQLE